MDKEDALTVSSRVAGKILMEITKPLTLMDYKVHITASIGIVVYPRDGDNLDDLLKNADSAMYHAKAKGKNNYQFYSKEFNAAAIERLSLENKLHRGLEAGEFELYYQPKVATNSGEIIGAEALLRWNHLQEGLISPAKFIPLAEETGLIVPIGEWVIHTACSQAKAWLKQGFPPIPIAVNISALQFRQPDLAQKVMCALEATGLEPAGLELEIVEGAAMENLKETIRILKELHDKGLQLAIDDFSTGYSSLNYLKYFPIHTLKVDQSFVRNLTTSSKDAAIVKSIIVLAHSLGLSVVAEGVEPQEQLKHLRSQACEQVQGYLFSPPRPAEEFTRLLAAQREFGSLSKTG